MPRQDGRSREEEEDECASYGGSIDQNESSVRTQHNPRYIGRQNDVGESRDVRVDVGMPSGYVARHADSRGLSRVISAVRDDAEGGRIQRVTEWEGTGTESNIRTGSDSIYAVKVEIRVESRMPMPAGSYRRVRCAARRRPRFYPDTERRRCSNEGGR